MTATALPHRATVVPLPLDKRLAPHRRRAYLERLLETRQTLSRLAAEQRSHGLLEAVETYTLMLCVEDTLAQEFPAEHQERLTDWLDAEGANEHPVGVLQPDCTLCRAVSNATGVNLVRPQAA